MKKPKILVAEDESQIREIIREYGQAEGFGIEEACNGAQAIAMASENEYDLILLDIMMPEVDGWVACREIRAKSDVPIIMLSARAEEYDKLFGFELGVDDYVTKPFSPKELMARIKAHLKRTKAQESQVIKFGALVIDDAAKTVALHNKRVSLTPKEYDLLEFLTRNPGIAFSREKLLDAVWGYDYYGEDRTIDTHIKAIRNAIKEYRKCIVTVWGVGYRFEWNEKTC